MDSYMSTVSGKRFCLNNPDPATICVTDIAAALSKSCRYGGHSPRHYSVAEHSCAVAQMIYIHYPELALAALLHDAAEAYCGDVISPLKKLLGLAYSNIEFRISEAIYLALDVAQPFDDANAERIHQADLAVGAAECAQFGIQVSPGRRQIPALTRVRFLSPENAETEFLDSYRQYRADRPRWGKGARE